MIKLLFLQAWYGLSDQGFEYQANSRWTSCGSWDSLQSPLTTLSSGDFASGSRRDGKKQEDMERDGHAPLAGDALSQARFSGKCSDPKRELKQVRRHRL